MLNEVAHLSGSELARLMSAQRRASGQTNPGELIKKRQPVQQLISRAAPAEGKLTPIYTPSQSHYEKEKMIYCAGCIFIQKDKNTLFTVFLFAHRPLEIFLWVGGVGALPLGLHVQILYTVCVNVNKGLMGSQHLTIAAEVCSYPCVYSLTRLFVVEQNQCCSVVFTT